MSLIGHGNISIANNAYGNSQYIGYGECIAKYVYARSMAAINYHCFSKAVSGRIADSVTISNSFYIAQGAAREHDMYDGIRLSGLNPLTYMIGWDDKLVKNHTTNMECTFKIGPCSEKECTLLRAFMFVNFLFWLFPGSAIENVNIGKRVMNNTSWRNLVEPHIRSVLPKKLADGIYGVPGQVVTANSTGYYAPKLFMNLDNLLLGLRSTGISITVTKRWALEDIFYAKVPVIDDSSTKDFYDWVEDVNTRLNTNS
jgi:hypothetical protein